MIVWVSDRAYRVGWHVLVIADALHLGDHRPCSTGTCAKMAVPHAKRLLGVGQNYVNLGPLGTTFTETTKGPYNAIIPSLSGCGWISGITQYLLDPTDLFLVGFTVGDIWD